MTDYSFNYLWDNAIFKSIERVEKECIQIDKIHGNMYAFARKETHSLKKAILSDYTVVRDQLKKRYYRQGDSTERGLIDVHKIATCITYAISRNKVFDFVAKPLMPVELSMSNYRVAFRGGLGVVYTVLGADYYANGFENYAEKLHKQGELLFPKTTEGHDSYETGRIHSMALNSIYGNSFDLLGYADMLFWIEHYNRQLIENKIVPVEMDRESLLDIGK